MRKRCAGTGFCGVCRQLQRAVFTGLQGHSAQCLQVHSLQGLHGVYMGFTWVYRVHMGFAWGLHGFTGFTRAGLQGVNIEHRVGLHGLPQPQLCTHAFWSEHTQNMP